MSKKPTQAAAPKSPMIRSKSLAAAEPPTKQADPRAKTWLRPSVQSALTLRDYNKGFGELPLESLIAELEAQSARTRGGDMAQAEKMLIAQAQALDAIFNNLARRAASSIGSSLNLVEGYLRLSLKAQAQCRATLEALASIKNPQQVSFVRQANIAHGPQQVNNSLPPVQATTAENENRPNELMEDWHGERVERGAASTTSFANKELEAMGALDRTKDKGG